MRYYISFFIFVLIAVVWREIVTKKASQNYDLGLCGIFAIACVGVAIAAFITKLITGRDPNQTTDPKLPTHAENAPQGTAAARAEPITTASVVPEKARPETAPPPKNPPIPHQEIPLASPKTSALSLAPSVTDSPPTGDGSNAPTENPQATGVRVPMFAYGIGACALIVLLAFVWIVARDTANKPAASQQTHPELADAKQQLGEAKNLNRQLLAELNRLNAELVRRDDERAAKVNPDSAVHAQEKPAPDNAHRVAASKPLEKARDEASAEKALKALGGSVRRDHRIDAKPIVDVDLANTKATDADLRALAATPMLQYLNLRGTDVTDEGLRELLGLRDLTNLVLSQTNVTDFGMKELAAIKSLNRLDVSDTAVTAKGLSAFQEAREKLGHPQLLAIVHK